TGTAFTVGSKKSTVGPEQEKPEIILCRIHRFAQVLNCRLSTLPRTVRAAMVVPISIPLK
ncbi:MAG: hypothetical protein P8X57_09455, partial [Cyclobacteriaceae bacterium]